MPLHEQARFKPYGPWSSSGAGAYVAIAEAALQRASSRQNHEGHRAVQLHKPQVAKGNAIALPFVRPRSQPQHSYRRSRHEQESEELEHLAVSDIMLVSFLCWRQNR
jgi:hypothetical protein